MTERNDFFDKINKLTEALQKARQSSDDYADIINTLNKQVGELNSIVLSGNADRTKAYEFILELSKVVRNLDPANRILSNPNEILAQVNYYSAERMKESSRIVSEEINRGTLSQFSKDTDKDQFIRETEKRVERSKLYKNAADAGIFDVDPKITSTF